MTKHFVSGGFCDQDMYDEIKKEVKREMNFESRLKVLEERYQNELNTFNKTELLNNIEKIQKLIHHPKLLHTSNKKPLLEPPYFISLVENTLDKVQLITEEMQNLLTEED